MWPFVGGSIKCCTKSVRPSVTCLRFVETRKTQKLPIEGLRIRVHQVRKNTIFRIWYQNVQQNLLCLVPESTMLCFARIGWLGGTTGSTSLTNDRKVAGSRPTKVVCITVLTGKRMGVNCPRCGRPPLLLPSCRKLEFRLSALMDSDLA